MWHSIACLYWMLCSLYDFDEYAWTPPGHVQESNVSTQYVYAFMWTIMVTTGNGNTVLPETEEQAIFTIFAIISGVLMTTLMIGSASSAISDLDASKANCVGRFNEHNTIY
eukprot:TRINITY_DN3259_c0_g1_i1.p1 TRINITY_DN3259_c0_g1~~TRINITY_DN3259_c0_g1_i1.p1  ORF type:complete len:111 (-),score=9.35 TRINITY_DN3259_c0_g1_i1:171-503(-)